MDQFTLGFVFNAKKDKVLLMHKNRPDWQRGRLNGIGGRIEEGETSIACMVREAEEETTLSTRESDWHLIANHGGKAWSMDVYAHVHRGDESAVQTCTDEKVEWFPVDALPPTILSNIAWLVPLSLDILNDKNLEPVIVRYQ